MRNATPMGFEPLRAEPNGFLVHHLNHSVTVSSDALKCMHTVQITVMRTMHIPNAMLLIAVAEPMDALI